ncbi:MAG: succinate--CoA ligase subunit alpha [Candidatus Odinarchaeota archaeon]|nr:succinate--CoA ligase subunit alpha [Candidatus Odinarchaeota archaeon]
MAILVNNKTKAIVQGITGTQGSFHTKLMLEYGTKIVAGVTPGKGGQEVHGVPVYDTVKEALSEHDANASIIFVPAPFAKDAVLEGINAGLELIVVITEHIPIKDTIQMVEVAKRNNVNIVGPNTPGVITPGECKLGIMPGHIFKRGPIGIISRSGTLTYEIASNLTKAGFGQSTCLGIGGDPIIGINFVEALEMFANDHETKAVVLIGEIGGDAEEKAAEYIRKEFNKPVTAFIAGKTAPPGKRMGHAGAIISGRTGTAQSKVKALKDAGVHVVDRPREISEKLKEILS